MFGQISFKGFSERADYIQLDICGLNVPEAIAKYEYYVDKNRRIEIPVVLHGDWSKNGCSENNLEERYPEYLEIFRALRKRTQVIGLTLHPPYRRKMERDRLMEICSIMEKFGLSVFIENRSNRKIYLSKPNEIVEFSNQYKMTIDIPQLYISCGYSDEVLKTTLNNIHWGNVKEVHMANLLKRGNNTFVGRKIADGEIDIDYVLKYVSGVEFITLEILGGVNTFETQILEIIKRQP